MKQRMNPNEMNMTDLYLICEYVWSIIEYDWHYTKWIYRNYPRLWSDRYRADLSRNVDGYPSLLPVISGPGSDRQTWNPTAWKAPGNIMEHLEMWWDGIYGIYIYIWDMGWKQLLDSEWYRNFMRKIEIHSISQSHLLIVLQGSARNIERHWVFVSSGETLTIQGSVDLGPGPIHHDANFD